MRKAVSLIGLAIALVGAYGYDRWVLPPLRHTAGQTFDPAPMLWTEMIADVAIALAMLALVWLVFRWSPPSRLVGVAYLAAGLALVGAWPLAVAFRIDLPGFAPLDLYLILGQGVGLLILMGPFATAIGLARLVLPLPTPWSSRLPAAGPLAGLTRN